MSLSYISASLRRLVEERARGRCEYCGSDLGSFDPATQNFTFLFHPRTQQWEEHFRFEGAAIIGLTPEGRTTARLLQLNTDQREAERRKLGS